MKEDETVHENYIRKKKACDIMQHNIDIYFKVAGTYLKLLMQNVSHFILFMVSKSPLLKNCYTSCSLSSTKLKTRQYTVVNHDGT